MSHIILPRRFTQQPQYPAEIDKSHSLSNVWNAINVFDSVIGNMATFSGGAIPGVGVGGRSWYFPQTNGNNVAPPSTTAFANSTNSGLALISGGTGGVLITSGDNSNAGFQIRIGRTTTAGTNFAFIRQNQALVAESAAGVWDAGLHCYTWSCEGDGTSKRYKAWVDGRIIIDTTATSTYTHGVSKVGDQGAAGGYVPFGGHIHLLAFAKGVEIAPARLQYLSADPWQIFRRSPQVLYFDVVGGVTGTGALTASDVTASGTGTLSHTGTGTPTTNAVTASGTGVISHTGTGSLTTSTTTASGTGTVTSGVTGTGAVSIGAVTASGAGTLAHTGTGAATVGAVTASGAGTLSHTGTGALTASSVTASGTGTLSHTGTGAVTVGNVTVSGTGSLGAGVTGTGSITIGNVTVSGTGTRIGWDVVSGDSGSWSDVAANSDGWSIVANASGSWTVQ